MNPEAKGMGTPPVEAGQDLLKTLEELRAILYSIGDGVIVTDPACRITRMNPVACRLTGWSEAEATGVHLDAVFHIVDERSEVQVETVADRILREGKTVGLSNHTLLISRDGTARPIADCGSPVFDPQGFIVGMVLIFRDQSAQRAAQQALKESEERHRTVADLTYDWEYWQAPDGEMLYVSPSCQRITGYRRDEFIAHPGLMEEILHPDDRPIWDRHQTVEGEIEQELEFRIVRRDGDLRWISSIRRPAIRADGTSLGLRVSNRDITARKRAEQALHEERRLFIGGPTVVFKWRAAEGWPVEYVSPNVLEQFGYPAEALMSGALPFSELVHPDDLERVAQEVEAHTLAGAPVFEQEYRLRHADGEYRWLYDFTTVTRNGQGVVTHFHGYVQDITDRRLAEEECRTHINFLESLEKIDRVIKQATDATQMLWNLARTVQEIFRSDRTWLVFPCDPEAPSFRVPVEVARPEYPGAAASNVEVPVSPSDAGDMREALQTSEPVTYTAGTDRPINRSAEQFGVRSQMFTAVHPKLGPPWVFGMHQCAYPRAWTDQEKSLFKEIARRMSDGLSGVLFLRELKENEERFRSTFEQAAVGIAHVSPYGHWLRVNQKLCDIVGYPREELLQRTFQDITHPDDLDADLEYVRQMLAGEISTYGLEKRYVRRDGSWVWINLTVSLVRNPDGTPTYFISVVEDISERKRSEAANRLANERFASVLRAATAYSIIATDPEGVIKVVNEGAELMLGYRAAELVDQTTPLILHDWNEVTARAREQGIEPGFGVLTQKAIQGETDTREWTYLRRDGTRLTVSLTIGARRNEDGTLAGYVGIARDVTVEKQLQRQILQSQRMESVGLLAGGVAHDFNNLLTPIMGYAEMVQSWLPKDDPLQEPVAEIGRAANLAKELTQRLLAFSRKQVIALETIDLGDIIRRFRTMLRRIIRENVAIEVDQPATSSPVLADPGQIEQVLVNLAINAQDAMPVGGVLTIETKDVDLDETYTARHLEVAPGPYVMLAVSDTGVGMDEATMARIFEPFFTTKESGKGTGLGLSTVYGIVKQHHGSISVYSEKGHGSTFKIFLPRALEDGATRPSPQPDLVRRGTESVLVVEDDETVRALVCKMLQSLGYEVMTAQGVEPCAALAGTRKGSLHLLLTDVVMPGMNGRELYERLRQQRPELKVLFMSGYTTNVIGHHGVLDEGVHLLQKPFTLAALSKKLREVLDS